MKTVRRLFYADILASVAFVAAAFLSLFFFIDVVDEVGRVGTAGFGLPYAALHSLVALPRHFYELAPIAVLIGTIYTLARLGQSSEYTILRTGGLGPGRALRLLAVLGAWFGVLTFVVGDYVAPAAEQQESALRGLFHRDVSLGGSGAWLKDRTLTESGERSDAINIGGIAADGALRDVRIFEFDASGTMLRRIAAERAVVHDQHTWTLEHADVTQWLPADQAAAPRVDVQTLPTLQWQSTLSAAVVAAAVSSVGTMSTFDLWRYIGHLSSNAQAAQRYEIQFWKRALYPAACVVMIALALPFAYLQARAGGVSWKVFGGIMLGISFVLLNNVAGHLGLLHNWTPWIVASAPSAFYLLLSLVAFGWLVKFR